MTDTPFLRDKITSLFRSPPGDTRLGDEPPGTIADAVLAVVAPLLVESQAQTAQALRWLDQERELAKRASESEQVQHAEEIGHLLRRAGVPADALLAAALGYGLAEDDIDLLQWLLAESEWKRRHVEASRRDWAAEAMRLDHELKHGAVVEPDWSALKDACYDYYCAYMHEDDSLLPAALDKVRRAMDGEDPYAIPDGEVSGG